jgi:hypothetical protein
MFSLSVDYQSVDAFRILPTYTEGGLMTISTIAFIFNVGALIYMIYSSVKYKRNPLKQEININTKYYKKSLQDNNLA